MFVKWYLPANTSSIANQGNITILLFAKWLPQDHNIQSFVFQGLEITDVNTKNVYIKTLM